MQILSSECQISFLWKIYERLSEKATAYSRGCALSMLRDDDIEQIFLADIFDGPKSLSDLINSLSDLRIRSAI